MDPPPLWVLGSGSLPPGVPVDFWGRLAAAARERDIRMALDTSGDALAAAGVDLPKPNARERAEVVGRTLETEDDQEDAARRVVEGGGARLLLLTGVAAGAAAVATDGTGLARAGDVERLLA